MVLRLLEFVARHGVPLAAETERRLEAVREPFRIWCETPRPLWRSLKTILALPHAAMALRVLQNTGLMQVLFPEWESVVSLVVRDFYHRYTVDEHTLVCIERLEALRATQDPAARHFAGLLSEIDDPAVLLFALLYHDVGKGAFTGHHSDVSLEWAQGSHEAHAGSPGRAGHRGIPGAASPGAIGSDDGPRFERSHHGARAGRSRRHDRTLEDAGGAHLRGYLRREPGRDDSVAAGATVACVSRGAA